MEETPKPLKASRSATEAGHSASASASTLDMKPCDSKLWLMKVPNFLLEHWMTRNEGRPAEVGTVKEIVGADGKKSMTLQLSEQADYPKEWPREYDFGVDAALTSMHVFSTGAKGTMQMDGRVEKRVPTVPACCLICHPSAARPSSTHTHPPTHTHAHTRTHTHTHAPHARTHARTPRLDVCQGEVKPQGLSKQYRAIMKNRVERDQVRHGVQTYQEDARDTGMVQLTVRHTYYGCTYYGLPYWGMAQLNLTDPISNHHLHHYPNLHANLTLTITPTITLTITATLTLSLTITRP